MKKKNLTFFVLVVLVFALVTLPILGGCDKEKVYVLKVYNAQDYIEHNKESSVLRDFEVYCKEKLGKKVRVQYDTFDTLERAYTIINKRKADYDVFCPSDYIIEKMEKNGLLRELDLNKIPNIQNVAPYLLGRSFDPENKYSVPYMWGTVGILYNADKIAEEDLINNSWDLLWNEKYKNKILMKDSIRDSVFIATIYAHKDELLAFKDSPDFTFDEYRNKINQLVNHSTDDVLLEVEKVLRNQYNILYAYEVDSGKDAIINGEAYINLAWSGDAVYAIEEATKNGINLDYYVPSEGSNIWFDNWVIPKYSKEENLDLAHEFINFMCDPEIAFRNSYEVGYTTAVMSEEILDNMMAEDDDNSIEEQDITYLFMDKNDKISPKWQEFIDNLLANDIDISAIKIHEVYLPSTATAEVCVEMTDFGDRQDAMVKMWTRVKALPLGVEVKIFSVCLAIALVALIAYSIYKKVEKKKLLAVKIEQIGENTNNVKPHKFEFLNNFATKTKEFAGKIKQSCKGKKKTNQTDETTLSSNSISENNCDNAESEKSNSNTSVDTTENSENTKTEID